MADSPVTNQASVRADPTPARIQDLDQVLDANISLSMFLAVDFPSETLKATWQQLVNSLKAQIVDGLYPVGHVLTTLNNTDPASYGYPGTWVKLSAGTYLAAASADGSDLGGEFGANSKPIPAAALPSHNHTASFTGNQLAEHGHPATVDFDPLDPHIHDGTYSPGGSGGGGGQNLTPQDPQAPDQEPAPQAVNGVSAGTPNGDITITAATAGTPAGSVTVDNAGAGGDFDVRPKTLTVNIWKRTV